MPDLVLEKKDDNTLNKKTIFFIFFIYIFLNSNVFYDNIMELIPGLTINGKYSISGTIVCAILLIISLLIFMQLYH